VLLLLLLLAQLLAGRAAICPTLQVASTWHPAAAAAVRDSNQRWLLLLITRARPATVRR
jgi:hypothetical protein